MSRSIESDDHQAQGFASPPDPGQAATLDDMVELLRLLKVWAGDPSYERLTNRINRTWNAPGCPTTELARKTTVVDCFRSGRRRINSDLVIAIVQALHPDTGYVTQWRQALRIIGGETRAASQVRVCDGLPSDLPGFVGRGTELDQLRQALHRARRGGGAVVCAIEGMAGVGKTQLAIQAGHLLAREQPFDRVLFVNLRGFHPDPGQPPADPAAVLDGFLRLLGVPGQQIPYGLDARAAAYRVRLAGTRTLVVLDNAADTDQVRPLLSETPRCPTLVTSRRGLTDLPSVTHLTLNVFTPEEAVDFLARAVSGVAIGSDPRAMQRIAARCGQLPLALALVAGHIRSTPGWTFTDHADRLDERHRRGHLDTGVLLALGLSYEDLPADQKRLLRLAALHPGEEFDIHAAAALSGTGLAAVREHLRRLCREHLLEQVTPGRYSLHDLVRAYAVSRAGDLDTPRQRRDALTRLFDYYAAAAATAMAAAHPRERRAHPPIPPSTTAAPGLADRDRADQWLDTELPNLLAAAHHAAENGRPEQTWQISAVVAPHLLSRGRHHEAKALHQHALQLARDLGNRRAEGNALNGLGQVHRRLGDYKQANDFHRLALQVAVAAGDRAGQLLALNGLGQVNRLLDHCAMSLDCFGRALQIAEEIGDRAGELDALYGLGRVHGTLGNHEQARGYHSRTLKVSREIGDRTGELSALIGLGDLNGSLRNYEQAGLYFSETLRIARDAGDRVGELNALHGLGNVQRMLGRAEHAADLYHQALRIAEAIGHSFGVLNALHGLGHVHRILGHHGPAADYFKRVFEFARELGIGNWQYEALQGMGRLHHATGHHELAITHHQRALQCATDLCKPEEQARAHDGLAHAHYAVGRHEQARRHWQNALDIIAGLGTDHTEEPDTSVSNIRAHLANLDQQPLTANISGGQPG